MRQFTIQEQDLINTMYNNYKSISEIRDVIKCGIYDLRQYINKNLTKHTRKNIWQNKNIQYKTKHNYQTLSELINTKFNSKIITPIKDVYNLHNKISFKCCNCDNVITASIQSLENYKYGLCKHCSQKIYAKQNAKTITQIVELFKNDNYEIINNLERWNATLSAT